MLATIFIIGAFQSFFFAVVLLSKRQNHLANRYMGLWLAALGLSFVESWVTASGVYREYPHLSGVFSGVPLLHGPFFWLYTYHLLNPQRAWRPRQLVHFLPASVYYLTGLGSFFFLTGEEKVALMDALVRGSVPPVLFVWGILKTLHGLGYMAWILHYIRGYEGRVLDRFSNPEKLRVKWLKALGMALLGIYLFALLNIFVVQLLQVNLEFILGLLSAVLILAGGYLAMRQGALFRPDEWPRLEADRDANRAAFSGKTKEKIRALMERERLYLDPDLTLQQLADRLDISPKELSKTLNQGFGVNFFTFVNRYRVEEVIRQMKDPANDHLSLLGIAFQSGFNSKTTFNTVFKKVLGKTPSQFKAELNS